MKRIIAAMAVMMVLCLFIVGAGAIESDVGAVGSDVESVSEGVFETSETVAIGAITEVETADVEEIVSSLISGNESKAQAVIKLAGLMGITVEDAEALIDSFIAFGDQHFEESDLWATLKADVNEHPDKWIMIALISLAFLALVVFLIRSVVKNTMTQTNTKIKIASIESHAACVEKQVGEQKEELDIIKAEAEELREMLKTALQLLTAETVAVDTLRENSDKSLAVTTESSLQILQLLNIAMDRKVPIASEKTRKLWYEDSVAKIKSKAGIGEQAGDTAGGGSDE